MGLKDSVVKSTADFQRRRNSSFGGARLSVPVWAFSPHYKEWIRFISAGPEGPTGKLKLAPPLLIAHNAEHRCALQKQLSFSSSSEDRVAIDYVRATMRRFRPLQLMMLDHSLR